MWYKVFQADATVLADEGVVSEVVPDNSIDAIVTDPLYAKEYLYLWNTLGVLAKRKLKPGGQLYAMSGTIYLPEIINMLGKYLNWRGIISDYLSMTGGVLTCHATHIIQHWKPILWYYKNDGAGPGEYLGDIVYSDRVPKKNLHEYQQNLLAFENLIKTHIKPGCVVYDPFCGSGTTGEACLLHGVSFIGSDIKESCVQTTIERLKKVKIIKLQKLMGYRVECQKQ